MVKKRIIKRGAMHHVESEKARLGTRFNPDNESDLNNLPYDMNIDTIPLSAPIRAPLPEPLPKKEPSPIPPTMPPGDYPDMPIIDDGSVQVDLSGKKVKEPDTKVIDAEYSELQGGLLEKIRKIGQGPARSVQDAASKGVGAIDKVVGYSERGIGVEDTTLSSTNDKLAIEGGAKYLSDAIARESQRIRKLDEEQRTKLNLLSLDLEDAQQKLKQELIKQGELLNRKRQLDTYGIQSENDAKEYANITMELKKIDDKIEDATNKERTIKFKIKKLNEESKQLEKLSSDNREHKAEYERAVIVGKTKYKKEHGWRSEWAKPVGENVSSLIGAPTIGDISKQVGYGDLTGKTFSAGMNAVVGKVKVSDTANEWVRTKAGDRGLVEALVKVNQSGMIAPFGSPGTIQHSQLGNQFSYSLPLKQIGVGDVTAMPGYRLSIEDIHRKKGKRSSPNMVRKAALKSTPKATKSNLKKVAVKGNLKVNLSIPTLASIGKSNNTTKLNTPVFASIGGTKDNKRSLNMNNIVPFAPKNFEIGLNNVSNSMSKKKSLKVNI